MPVGSGSGRAAWGTAGWTWRRVTNGVATPAGRPSRYTSMRVRSSGS